MFSPDRERRLAEIDEWAASFITAKVTTEKDLEELIGAWEELVNLGGDDARRALCRHDRFYLLTQELSRPDACHPWLYNRCRDVERAPDGHLDLWAREHYKSTIITFAGSIQEILKNPNITIGIFSHTKPNARKFLTMIKEELERNQSLQALFPDILWSHPHKDAVRWSEEKGIAVKRTSNSREATVEAHGLVDGMPTGSHFMLRIYDDVVTEESVTTPEMVEKTNNRWALSDNLGARGDDGLMRAWHIGTRYSFADTYQFILDRKLLTPRIFAATDDGTISGKPVFLSQAAWALKLKLPLSIVSAQQLQNPAAGTQKMFQVEWLRFLQVRPSTLNVYITVDPASSKKKGSDYTAMMVTGVDAAGNKYLLDGYRHKMGLTERWEKMRGLRQKWMREPGVQNVFVGYERYGADSDMEYFQEKMRQPGQGGVFEITELAWPNEGPGSKADRVQRLEPDFKAGRFYLAEVFDADDRNKLSPLQQAMVNAGQGHRVFTPPRQIDPNTGAMYSLNKVLIDEYLLFPFSSTKDAIDALSRIYDMNPLPPVIIPAAAFEPQVYSDGV